MRRKLYNKDLKVYKIEKVCNRNLKIVLNRVIIGENGLLKVKV